MVRFSGHNAYGGKVTTAIGGTIMLAALELSGAWMEVAQDSRRLHSLLLPLGPATGVKPKMRGQMLLYVDVRFVV